MQIRNTGTVGGALGSVRPAGDLLTFLTAADAEVLTASPRGPDRRSLPRFLADGLAPDALVTAVRLARPGGPQVYLKIGDRQAAYPAVVSCAVLVDRVRHRLTCAIGGVGMLPARMGQAERYARDEVDWSTGTVSPPAARRFGDLVVEEAARVAPALSADPRGSVEYRWHAAGVLAGRAFARCLHHLTAPPPATPRGAPPPVGSGDRRVRGRPRRRGGRARRRGTRFRRLGTRFRR